MAPNPKVVAAFRAMSDLGISVEKVKPILKKLLKLYDKNWELIEEGNYRALADAIFEDDETKETEQKKKPRIRDTNDEGLDEEAQGNLEPERPLKRLRLRGQEGPSSVSNHSPNSGGLSLIRPKVEEEELPGALHSQRSQDMMAPQNARDESQLDTRQNTRSRRKQPVSPKPLAIDGGSSQPQPHVTRRSITPRATHEVRSNEPTAEPSNTLLPRKKVPSTPALIKPKDEPYADGMPNFEVPIAVIHPDKANGQGSLGGNVVSAVVAEESPSNMEIASSSSGGVKISLSCNPVGSNFQMPSLDAIMKLMEDKILRSYKIVDPNFSMKNLLRNVCNSIEGLGNQSNPESRENLENALPAVDLLKKPTSKDDVLSGDHMDTSCIPPSIVFSDDIIAQEISRPLPAQNCFDDIPTSHESNPESRKNSEHALPAVDLLKQPTSRDDVLLSGDNMDTSCIPPSIVFSDDMIAQEISRSLPARNFFDDIHESLVNGCSEINDGNSHSLVVVPVPQCELTPSDLRSLHHINDITRGEENISISWLNEINKEFPPAFQYISQNSVFDSACVNFTLYQIEDTIDCATCIDSCLVSSVPCSCANDTGGEYAYTSEGHLKQCFLDECVSVKRKPKKHHFFYCGECPVEKSKKDDEVEPCNGHLRRKFIKECWIKCGCNKQWCGNRVVQRGISCKLQVFMTPNEKGWGLRTLEELPKGAFVCEFVGEILTNAELHERSMRNTKDHSNSVLLDAGWGSGVPEEKKALCLDSTLFGNVARFINHRCLDANLVEIPVEVETPDRSYYHVALFTTRKVDAMEELTRDYGVDFDDQDHQAKPFQCLCGSKFCRNMKRTTRSRSAVTGS